MTANPRQNPARRLPDWRITMPLAHASPRCGARTRARAATAATVCCQPTPDTKEEPRLRGGAAQWVTWGNKGNSLRHPGRGGILTVGFAPEGCAYRLTCVRLRPLA